MDRLPNNTTATSGSYNIVEIDEESQNIFKLTTDQFEFLEMVANTVHSAAMHRNSYMTPRQMSVTESNNTDFWKLSGEDAEGIQQLSKDCMQSDLVNPKRQPVLQLQVAKRRNHNAKFATLGLSEVLAKALLAAAVRRSLNHDVIPVRFPRRITLDVIGGSPFGNVAITDHRTEVFRQPITVEIVSDLQQMSTNCVQSGLVEPKRQPVLHLQVAKRRNHNAKFATLGLSELLAKALRAVAVRRSLNHDVIPVRFPRRITLDIDKYSTVFRQSTTAVELVSDLQQMSTDCVQTADIVMLADIQHAVPPAVICPRQTDDDIIVIDEIDVEDDRQEAKTAVRRRRPILSALGRRLLKVGRMLCCWCSVVPSEDTK